MGELWLSKLRARLDVEEPPEDLWDRARDRDVVDPTALPPMRSRVAAGAAAFLIVAGAGVGGWVLLRSTGDLQPSSAGNADQHQRYGITTLVVEKDGGGPMLCLAGWADIAPPQCGDVPISPWDWREVEGEERRGGTTWGTYRVEGTFDGVTFTVEDVAPPGEPDPDPVDDSLLRTPCSEPDVGWVAPEPTRTSERAFQEAARAAEAEEDFAGLWISWEGKVHEDIPHEMRGKVLNVAFTGPLERHEEVIRELWGGPLCVIRYERTYRELKRIQRELTSEVVEELGLHFLGSDIDIVRNVVVLDVVVTDAEREAALTERFGEGSIRVSPALRPLG